ncbi:MAG: SurA N-terminal domain-containing protein [Gammaproteobacteria bacterium]|nr:SurA N-terminal domain-containing protein [Planctomycetaceae bacterium]MCB1672523.1 SurA N-terminal domain-containing protein [Pseudomonadales bacterium]MCP5346355.1 SurA N-terminal domain-containing protein [Pseudomonadales bacterium]
MLQDIRDHTQGVIAKVIIGLIVAVFALWGVQSIIGGFVTAPSVAEVNGEEITEQQLTISTQNLVASLGGNTENIDQGLLEQVALNQLIEEVLLRQAAERAGLGVSDARIDRAILQNPSFQIDGRFDPDLAVRTMASQGMNVPLYREQLGQSILLSQLANAFSATGFVTQAELQRVAALRLQTRDFRFVSLTLGSRTLGEPIPDEDIAEYYRANQDEFAIPEMIDMQYVELSRANIMDEIEIDEQVIRDQYEQERSAFEGSAERRASHILFEVGPSRTEAQALEQASAARQRLEDGEDFGALALELSDDVISAEQGGDIGYSDGTAFPPAIEEALETMDVDQVSEPIVTEFGVHLVKLTEDTVTEFASYEEVSDRITRELKAAQAEQIYARRLEDMSNMAFESADLQPISEALGLTIQESGLFPRTGGEGLFANPTVVDAAFSEEVLNSGFNSDPIEVNDSQAIVMRLLERQEASVRPLEEVEAEIAVILRTELERERARELGQQLLNQLSQGEDITALLEENELEWVEQDGVTRDSTAINREITSAAFSLPNPEDGDPVYEGIALTNGTYVVLELDGVEMGDLASMPEQERQGIEQSILAERSQTLFNSYLNYLRANADITTNQLSDEPLL